MTFIEIVYIKKLVPFKDKTLTSTYLTREFRSKQRTIIHGVATSIVQIKFKPYIHTGVWCGNKIFKRFLKLQARSYVTKSTVEESCVYLKFHEIKVVNTMYFNQQQNQSLFYCINFNFKSGFFLFLELVDKPSVFFFFLFVVAIDFSHRNRIVMLFIFCTNLICRFWQ